MEVGRRWGEWNIVRFVHQTGWWVEAELEWMRSETLRRSCC